MLPTDHFTAAIDGEGCSRGKSRVVRNYFNSILIPKLKLDPTTLSDTCIINTKSDIYALQEISKTETDNRDWKCKICGKRFVSEGYLDKHLAGRHKDFLQKNSTECLADYCTVFGCPEYLKSLANDDSTNRRKTFKTLERCDDTLIESITKQCSSIGRSCFKDEIQYNRFYSFVCKPIRCANGVTKGRPLDFLESSQSSLPYFIMRCLIIVAILIVVLSQVFYGHSNWYSNWFAPKRAVDRYRNSRNNSTNGNFLIKLWKFIGMKKD